MKEVIERIKENPGPLVIMIVSIIALVVAAVTY